MIAQGLGCVECGLQFPLEPKYHCDSCGGILEVCYDYETMKKRLANTRLNDQALSAALLPIEAGNAGMIALQPTPLLKADRLAKQLGIKELYLKCEFLNPTGSFKDRPVSVAVAKAREFNLTRLIVASSGNAAAATAAYAAKNSMQAIILVPESTPVEKIRQASFYGACVVKVKGPYSNCFHLARQAGETLGIFNVTTTFINPYTVEGDKIIAHEIIRQLGEVTPDAVYIPVGAGPILVGMYRGFSEFHQLGLSRAIPQLAAIQAEGCQPIAEAFLGERATVTPVKQPSTIAGGICDGLDGYAQDGNYALVAIRRSAGCSLAVSDADILQAQRELAQCEGLFVEPSGAVSIAGLRKSLTAGQAKPDEVIVVVLTGNGLKDMASIQSQINDIFMVNSFLELDNYIKQRKK